jgi:hypothetical protein
VKALSMLQPWASFWAAGIKRYETRSWSTNYRGPLAIHASQRKDSVGRKLWIELWAEDAFRAELLAGGMPAEFDDLPFGAIIATTDLLFCDDTDEIVLGCREIESLLGNFSPGRFAWQRGPVTMLAVPFPIKGRLGLWNWKGGGK